MAKKSRMITRYGIGEWYGHSLVELSPANRKKLAKIQEIPRAKRPTIRCPFQSTDQRDIPCTKQGGVCSLRRYTRNSETNEITTSGALCTTCPKRFQEGGLIFQEIGQTVLKSENPLIVGEVGFLENVTKDKNKVMKDDVGRIDNVIVLPGTDPLIWCAVEIQAVYFSGATMAGEFRVLAQADTAEIPFPIGPRRPDYRSSGPKRLMPQLQIKVPTLRRWGKKMVVVIDRNFFDAMGKMDHVGDMSNADIAWYVANYREHAGRFEIYGDFVRFTTLERAVEGLTAGIPVSLETFEKRILDKMRKIDAIV